jgi:hypothetical protein
MSKTMHVLGGFRTLEGARLAVDRLATEGVPRASIGILMSQDARQHFGTVEDHTKAAEGAAAGGIAGGVIGALLAGLTAVATIAAPGLGLLAAGPLVAMFAGAGAGAAAGGAVGGLIGLGMTEHEVKFYERLLKENGVLVTISTQSKEAVSLAKRILSQSGALAIETDAGRLAHL